MRIIFLTTGEVAKLLGVNPQTIRNWTEAGYLTERRIGKGFGHRRYLLSEVQTLEKRMAEMMKVK